VQLKHTFELLTFKSRSHVKTKAHQTSNNFGA